MAVAEYPYLLASVMMLLVFGLGFALVPDHRRSLFVSASLSAPFAFSSVLFVPEYWNPHRVAYFLAGPEDLVFSFAGGGLIWLLAIHLVSPRPRVSLCARRVACRYLAFTVGFFSLVLILVIIIGVGVMVAVVASGALLFVVLLALRPDLGRLAVRVGICYCVGYTTFFAGLFLIWPTFLAQWNWDNLTGLTVLSVPVEESVWALVFATCWTLGMGYAFDARLPEGAVRNGR